MWIFVELIYFENFWALNVLNVATSDLLYIFVVVFISQRKEEEEKNFFVVVLFCQTSFPRGESLSRKRTIPKEMTAKNIFFLMRCLWFESVLLLWMRLQYVCKYVSHNKEATVKQWNYDNKRSSWLFVKLIYLEYFNFFLDLHLVNGNIRTHAIKIVKEFWWISFHWWTHYGLQ